MRQITPASAIAASTPVLRPVTEVTSWLGVSMLGTIPVVGGTATEDGTVAGGTLELQVPALPDWIPTAPDHPLHHYGQELVVKRGWLAVDGTVAERVTIGRYLIHTAQAEGDVINVRADGIGQRIVNYRFPDPHTARAGSMLAQARRVIAGTGLGGVQLIGGLRDRTAGSRLWNRGDERADAWEELLGAWPCQSFIDPDSRSVLLMPPPVTTGNPVLTLTDGQAGTVVEVMSGGSGSDDGIPNAVVASSAPEDGSTPISAIATLHTGPRMWGGPYGARPAFYSSPLLTTPAQVQAAARTRLQNRQNESWDVTVSMASCPAVQRGDLVRVVSERARTDVVASVVSVTTALTPDDEPGGIACRAIRGTLGGVTL